MHILLAPAKIGAGMFAAKSHTSRHYIAIVVMACLCVLLGGPSYAAGAESLIIAGRDVLRAGRVRAPAGLGPMPTTLSLNGYAGEGHRRRRRTWC